MSYVTVANKDHVHIFSNDCATIFTMITINVDISSKIMTFSMIYDHFYNHIFQIYSMFVRYFFCTELFSHYHLNLKMATIATA